MQTLRRDTFAIILLLAAPAAHAQTKELARAEHVRKMLLEQQTIRNNRIAFEGAEYGITGWQVCPAFNGVCFLTESPGNPATVLAAYETVPGEVQVMGVRLKDYRKGRAQEAVQHYIRQGAATMNTVFKLTDAAGRPMFATDGTLTPAGEAAYEAALRGVKQEAPPPPDKKASAEDDKKAKRQIKDLLSRGFMEIGIQEYDCVRKVFKHQGDRDLGIVTVMQRQSPRRFIVDSDLDPTVVVIKQFRKNEFCGNSAVEQR